MARFSQIMDTLFRAIGQWFQSPLLLILRVFFGVSFVFTGLGKLQDIQKFTDYLISLHVPYPVINAWVVGLCEMIGGAFLAIGFLSRFTSLILICIMSVAYATAHVESIHAIFNDPKLFVSEPPFNFLLTALFVFAFGPGFFALDTLFARKVARPENKAPKT